jgi:hypothetical protein
MPLVESQALVRVNAAKRSYGGGEEIGMVAGRLEAAPFDAAAYGLIPAEQVQGEAAARGEVMGPMADPHAGCQELESAVR